MTVVTLRPISPDRVSTRQGSSLALSVSARRWRLFGLVTDHLVGRLDRAPDVNLNMWMWRRVLFDLVRLMAGPCDPQWAQPLFSTTVGYPTGINLIFAAFGVVLTPVTWLIGPVAALNVGLTLSPVLSALAMFALARRWVSWSPAAFVAGAFYGFSPFVLSNLSVAHVDFSMIAIPPLVVICLDELLIRQRRNPIARGSPSGC